MFPSGVEGPKATEEKMEISWLPFSYKFNINEDGWGIKLIESEYPVDITVPQMTTDNDEMRLTLSAGDIPDYFTCFLDFKWLADQEIIREVPETTLNKYMPGLMKSLYSFADKDAFKVAMTYKDAWWGVPRMTFTSLSPFIGIARKDWMDKVGIKDNPKTLDDYETMLRKFTKEDPDGNGKDDTYGTHGRFWMVYGALVGAIENTYFPKNGKVVFSSITDEYKNALKLLNSWYEEGFIDPEFVTDDRDTQRNKWSEGLFGALEEHPYWLAPSVGANLINRIKEKNDKAEVVAFPAYKGPTGMSGGYGYKPGPMSSCPRYFSAEVSDEKMLMIMRIEDRKYSDWDWWKKLRFGEEGVHHDVVDGIHKLKEEFSSYEAQCAEALGFLWCSSYTSEMASLWVSPEEVALYDISFATNSLPQGVSYVFPGKNESAEDFQADLDSIADEFRLNAITGRIDIDAEWNAYVQKWRAAGGDTVTAEHQKLYDEAQAILGN